MKKSNMEQTVDKMAASLLRHEEVLVTLSKEVSALKQQGNTVLEGQDKMLHILERLDQERLFTFERVNRLEEEITKIKVHLAIA